MERSLSEVIAQIETEMEDALMDSIEEENLKSKFFTVKTAKKYLELIIKALGIVGR